MRLLRFADVDGFWDRAGPYLVAKEAEHNLTIGLCANLRAGVTYGDGEPPYLAVVERDGDIVATALRTPPHPVTLSEVTAPEAIELLVDDLRGAYGSLSGINAPSTVARDFVERWTRRTGQQASLGMAQRIYRLDRVRAPDGVAGRLRGVTLEDLDLLTPWHIAFVTDIGMSPDDPATVRRALGEWINRGTGVSGLVFWEDGTPVSMAGFSGPTPNGIRVNRVYTPPELRGRGYASGCVAALSQRLLDEGRRFCFLFTDLSNPTSNSIYQRIGYEPVCDVDLYNFA
jgi:hypothetical protein